MEDPGIRSILRESAKQKLIDNIESWFQFHEARNLTSHTYNEKTAEEVYDIAIQLPKEAEYLLKKIQSKISKS